jgi:predicted molibdopterin-dependent oxidoreductase YjgC
VWAELITQAARDYAASKTAAIICDTGDADTLQALNNLALLTGKAGWVFPLGGQNNSQGACDMGLVPDRYPGYQEVGESTAVFEKAWGGTLNSSPGMNLAEMLEAAQEGSLKALYVVGADPLLNVADTDYVRDALQKLELLIVQDVFLSETAQLADVVLPAASFAETEGTFTNFEGRVQQVGRALEPLGEARADWRIEAEIAGKLGAAGFDYKAPADIMKEATGLCANSDRITQTTSDNGDVRWVHHRKGDEPPPPKASEESPDEEYPFLFNVERSLYCASVTTKVDGLNQLRSEELVEISPAEAAALGVAEGETVRVISQRGEATVKVKLTKSALPGVVCGTLHRPGSPLSKVVGSVVGPASRAPEVKSCAVRMEKL